MATNGHVNGAIPTLEQPPGHPSQPYIIPSLCGEIIYIPCSRSATRLLVTGKETADAFAVVGSGGAQSPPIGFHYHNQAHDVFLCLKGAVNVWANDQARTLSPGDFASVPPRVIHQYQILGTHTEFLGLIVPGGWEEFFRFIGEPYSGPLFPLSDNRNPFEVLIPKLKAAAERFDMIPCPQQNSFDPQPWTGQESKLSGGLEPYFLKNGSGPAYVVGGDVVRPLATMKESGNRFTISSVEGYSQHASLSMLSHSSGITFNDTHHCFQVSDGTVAFSINEVSTSLSAGETIYVPSGTTFSLQFSSRFAKMYVFSNGAGLSELMIRIGTAYRGEVPPEKATASIAKNLEQLKSELGFELS